MLLKIKLYLSFKRLFGLLYLKSPDAILHQSCGLWSGFKQTQICENAIWPQQVWHCAIHRIMYVLDVYHMNRLSGFWCWLSGGCCGALGVYATQPLAPHQPPLVLHFCLGFPSACPNPFGWLTAWPMLARARSLTVWPLARAIMLSQLSSSRWWN